MRYLQLRIRFPREARHPMHQLLVDEASVHRASLRHWNFSDPESVSMLFCVVGRGEVGREAYLDALEAVETVQEYEATVIDDGRFYVYLQETAHGHGLRIRTLLADTDLVVVPPIEYLDDGVMRLEVAGDQDHLRTLVAGLPDQLSVSASTTSIGRPRPPCLPTGNARWCASHSSAATTTSLERPTSATSRTNLGALKARSRTTSGRQRRG
jgi:hypothetical protein